MSALTIGQLAKASNVHVETVRYYERRGLLPEPPRRPSGYREYPEDSVARVRFIKSAQAMGFSLAEIETLLELRVGSGVNCDEVRAQAKTKLAEIRKKIRELQRLEGALAELVTACECGGPEGECPILDAFEFHSGRRGATDGDAL